MELVVRGRKVTYFQGFDSLVGLWLKALAYDNATVNFSCMLEVVSQISQLPILALSVRKSNQLLEPDDGQQPQPQQRVGESTVMVMEIGDRYL